jgi:hypothetical protein
MLVLTLSKAQVVQVLESGLQPEEALIMFTGLVAPRGRAAIPVHTYPPVKLWSSKNSSCERKEASVAPAACVRQDAREANQLFLCGKNLKQKLEFGTVLHSAGHPEVLLEGQ